MSKFIFLLIILSVFSCKNNPDADESNRNQEDSTAFQKKLKIEDPNYALEPEAKKYALNWVEFITAQNEVKKLEDATIDQVKNNASTIAQIMETLKNSVPDSLKSVAVEARLNVVNTKAQLLEQYSNRQDPTAEDIAQTTKELHLEFNNLKLQLNEIFLKTLEEFEKELDDFEEMEREMDSINDSNKEGKTVS